MSKSPRYLWANELASQAIEGASDAFLITCGGSAISQAGTLPLPAVTPHQLFFSMMLGAGLYAAAFLKKTPLPSAMPDQPPAPAAMDNLGKPSPSSP